MNTDNGLNFYSEEELSDISSDNSSDVLSLEDDMSSSTSISSEPSEEDLFLPQPVFPMELDGLPFTYQFAIWWLREKGSASVPTESPKPTVPTAPKKKQELANRWYSETSSPEDKEVEAIYTLWRNKSEKAPALKKLRRAIQLPSSSSAKVSAPFRAPSSVQARPFKRRKLSSASVRPGSARPDTPIPSTETSCGDLPLKISNLLGSTATRVNQSLSSMTTGSPTSSPGGCACKLPTGTKCGCLAKEASSYGSPR